MKARTFYANISSQKSVDVTEETIQGNEAEKVQCSFLTHSYQPQENHYSIFKSAKRKKRKRRSTILLDSDAASNSTAAQRNARKRTNNESSSTVPPSRKPRAESPSNTLSAISNYAPSGKEENKRSQVSEMLFQQQITLFSPLQRRNTAPIAGVRQQLHGYSPAPSPRRKVVDWSMDEHPLPLEDDFEKKVPS